MSNNSVYIIILNYNHRNDLVETLESFKKQDYSNFHLVVVDNNSSDDSVDYIQKHYPLVHTIQNNQNLGWSGGNNAGIQYALTQNAGYILLANNDIYFNDPRIISGLIRSLIQYPCLGIIGPQENEYDDKTKCANQGWIMYPKAKYQFNRHRLTASVMPSNYKIIDNVSGSFMLIKAGVFKAVGLIDDELFLYAEDADFSLRAWNIGYSSAIDTSLIIYHKGSATAGNNSPLKIYYKARNLIYLIKKHKALQELPTYFKWIYYYDCFKIILKIILLKEYKIRRFAILKAQLMGMYHGVVTKRMGKYY
jgi:GT2 family glycosyltransferase